jgi:beta-galactosidase
VANGKRIVHSQTISLKEDGRLAIDNEFDVEEGIEDLPRLGLAFELPASYENVEYFALGPMENHWDRKAAAKAGAFKTDVDSLYEPYIVPQENGTRCETRYVSIGDGKKSFEFRGSSLFAFRYGRFSREELEAAKHTVDLKRGPKNYLYIDYLQRGIGTASCGPDTTERHKLVPGKFRFVLEIAAR